jgi:hypothetical protein
MYTTVEVVSLIALALFIATSRIIIASMARKNSNESGSAPHHMAGWWGW